MNASDVLVFEPQNRYPIKGNEIQIATTNYKGVLITERTFFPWNPFKNIVVTYIVDLVLPMDTVVENGEMDDAYYTDEGFGLPVFSEKGGCILEEVLKFIDQYKGG